jgi:hypothetical protein
LIHWNGPRFYSFWWSIWRWDSNRASGGTRVQTLAEKPRQSVFRGFRYRFIRFKPGVNPTITSWVQRQRLKKITTKLKHNMAHFCEQIFLSPWSQSYDFWIYSYNASVVVG